MNSSRPFTPADFEIFVGKIKQRLGIDIHIDYTSSTYISLIQILGEILTNSGLCLPEETANFFAILDVNDLVCLRAICGLCQPTQCPICLRLYNKCPRELWNGWCKQLKPTILEKVQAPLQKPPTQKMADDESSFLSRSVDFSSKLFEETKPVDHYVPSMPSAPSSYQMMPQGMYQSMSTPSYQPMIPPSYQPIAPPSYQPMVPTSYQPMAPASELFQAKPTIPENYSYAQPTTNPFAQSFSQPLATPFANPFAQTAVNPFATPFANPFTQTAVNPVIKPVPVTDNKPDEKPVPKGKICRYADKCNSDQCPFLHPKQLDCKYNEKCRKANCPYKHSMANRILGQCKFGETCNKIGHGCLYEHPQPTVETVKSETPLKKVNKANRNLGQCKFGVNCNKNGRGCLFEHSQPKTDETVKSETSSKKVNKAKCPKNPNTVDNSQQKTKPTKPNKNVTPKTEQIQAPMVEQKSKTATMDMLQPF